MIVISGMTTPEQSIFVYPEGISHANFSHPGFIPRFLDDADQALVQNATQTCGAENWECIYDMVITGSAEFAMNTKQTGIEHMEKVNDTGMLHMYLITCLNAQFSQCAI